MRSAIVLLLAAGLPWAQSLAVRGETVYTMEGRPLANGVVVIEDGKIAAVGHASRVDVPDGVEVLEAKVVTPGLIDAHSVVGLAGWLNQRHDQDQLERSDPIQPELRAVDAYNPREPLVSWLRGFGVTVVHTGHAPGAVISGQTLIAKTVGDTVEEAVIEPFAMLACTLGEAATSDDGPPGNRSKAVALLRAELARAQEYARKRAAEDPADRPDRDLRLEALAAALAGEVRTLVTAHRAHDITTALRLRDEFGLDLVLDGAADAHLLVDLLKESGAPVVLHPTMFRAVGEAQNLSMETASVLRAAGVPLAMQSGYESYVPKTRVVLFEAAIAVRYGLSYRDALSMITIDAARLLGIDDRVGSLKVGKDADLALYDGDPFEYTSHCIGVVVDGEVVSREPR